ncbi:TCP-1/cpn60 chaperonin family protein [Haloferax sp. DFSO52]|uniref:TCP-1/cpn60 chaperonin family protein n=1 Tax=Haloferax sp. DFSO52 TaxID=3388505 RepID=UPI003A891F7A
MIRDASTQMGDLVRSTLGPLGMDKMVVRRMEDDRIRGFVSNDGVAIIEEFEGETDHPIAQHFIRLAEDQEDDYGDGTTTTVLLASDLLSTAMDLADQGVHPNDIIEGYSIGAQRTLERWNEMAIDLRTADDTLDQEKLEAIALTGMTNGRTDSWPLGGFAKTLVNGVLRVSNPATGGVRLDHAKTIAVPGGNVTDSELVEGVMLPKELVVAEHLLPATGSVLLINGNLQSRSLSTDVNINIETNDGARRAASGFNDSEGIAAAIGQTDTVAVVVSGDVDMAIAKELAGHGAVVLRNVKDSDFKYIAKATGASSRGPITPNTRIDPEVLGTATVRFRDTGREDDWVAFEPPAAVGAPAVTLLVRGGTQTSAEEAQRRIKDGKNALRACIKNPKALPAGGAADMAAATDIRSFANRFDGRKQLAIDAYADVLESIPKTLARNAGLDSITSVADLRTRHDAGFERAAISKDGVVVNDVTADGGGLEAFQVRVSGLVRAIEFVNHFIRIDSVLLDERPPSVERVLEEPRVKPGEVPE